MSLNRLPDDILVNLKDEVHQEQKGFALGEVEIETLENLGYPS